MEMAFDSSSSCGREIWRLSPQQALAAESPPRTEQEPHFPFEFPYNQSLSGESSFSSPVESLASPNETESEDDDDYTAGLAQRIAHSMLDDDDDDDDASNEKIESGNTNLACEQGGFWAASDATKVCLAASRARPTLAAAGSWSTRSWSSCSTGSSNGSSRVSSQVSSPSSTPMWSQGDAWDLLYAAAGEMLRLKMLEESKVAAACFHLQSVAQQAPSVRCNQTQQGPWVPNYASLVHPMRLSSSCRRALDPAARSSSFSSAVPGLCKDTNAAPASRFQRSMSLSTNEVLKLQTPAPDPCYGSSAWSRRQGRPITQSSCGGKNGPKAGCGQRTRWSSDVSSSQWLPLQPSVGSGMRAVFLGSSAAGRESTGTGVFLPRRGPECKKKPSCSTVLLPTRIVQALNLNVEDVHSPPMGRSKSMQWTANGRDCTSSLSSVTKAGGGRDAWSDATTATATTTKKLLSTSPLQQQETALPTEWTY